MIFKLLLDVLHGVAQAFVNLLPSYDIGPAEHTPISWPVAIAQAVFPVELAFGIIIGLCGWMVLCHTYRIVLWLLGVLHISGDGG